MRVTMDGAGRIVIPKELRDELRLTPGEELELRVEEGEIIELSRPSVPKRLEQRDGAWVLAADGELPPLTTEMVRDMLERGRR